MANKDDWYEPVATKEDWYSTVKPSNPLPILAGVVGALGSGLIIKNIVDKKAMKNASKNLLNQVKDIGLRYDIRNVNPQDIPSLLGDKISLAKSAGQISADTYTAETQKTIDAISKSLNDLKSEIIPKNVSETTDIIKTKYPSIIKEGLNNYGSNLKSISRYLEKRGINFTDTQFESRVIDRAVEIAKRTGASEKELADLALLKSSIQPKIEGSAKNIFEATGELAGEQAVNKMRLTRAKSAVSKFINANPDSHTAGILRREWGKFLEELAPDGSLKTAISRLNKSALPLYEMKNNMRNIIKGGKINKKALTNYLLDYALKNKEYGQEELFRLLNKGSYLTPNIGGLKGKTIEMGRNRAAKVGLETLLGNTKNMSPDDIKLAISKKVDEILSWQSKANELLAQEGVIAEKLYGKKFGAKQLAKLATKLPLKAMTKLLGTAMGGVGILDSIGVFDPGELGAAVVTDPIEKWKMTQQLIRAGKYPEIRARK
jgi:hypothetical protein